MEALSMGIKPDDKAKKTSVDLVVETLRSSPEGLKKLEQMVLRANQVVAQRALGVKPNLFGNADGSALEPVTATLASLISLAKGTVTTPSTQPPTSGQGGNPGGGAPLPPFKKRNP